MRKRRPTKAHKKTMLAAQTVANNGSNVNAEGPCDSPLSELRGLEKVRISKLFPRSSVLFTEGQTAKGVYVVCEGRVKISIGSSDGRTLVVRIAKAGEVLGVNAALTGHAHAVTAETLDRCRVDFIPLDDFLKLLSQDRRAILGIAIDLSRKLNEVLDHSRLVFVSRSASEKLARLLVQWAEESGQRTPQGTQINSRLTHEEIAQMIGTSRETVTRVLSEFKRNHIIGLLGDAICVRNRKALESVAGA